MLARLPLLIGVLLAIGCASSLPAPAAAPRALPAVELLTVEGKPEAMAAALEGRPALISLFATWCEACESELAPLQRLGERARSAGGLVISVAVGEPRSTVADFLATRARPPLVLVDEQFRFADAIGLRRVPSTLVIDRRGRVVYVGGTLDETAIAALRSCLAEVAAR